MRDLRIRRSGAALDHLQLPSLWRTRLVSIIPSRMPKFTLFTSDGTMIDSRLHYVTLRSLLYKSSRTDIVHVQYCVLYHLVLIAALEESISSDDSCPISTRKSLHLLLPERPYCPCLG